MIKFILFCIFLGVSGFLVGLCFGFFEYQEIIGEEMVLSRFPLRIQNCIINQSENYQENVTGEIEVYCLNIECEKLVQMNRR